MRVSRLSMFSPLSVGSALDTGRSCAHSRYVDSAPLDNHRSGLTTDMIHSVEAVHEGKGPSAVMYIPSVPLTSKNVEYVRDQRESFLAAKPPPDFPGGIGESKFKGTGRQGDIVESGRSR